MNRSSRLAVLGTALAGLLTPLLLQPAQAAAGFTVSGGRILDANGNAFVMRGVNHAHTWYPDKLSALADIKALGANTVRVVLASGDRWTRNDAADVTNVIDRLEGAGLVVRRPNPLDGRGVLATIYCR